jgi:hypothetical protein
MQLRTALDVWLPSRIGYGALDAPIWYIGTEEACGPNEHDQRLGTTPEVAAERVVEDLQAAHSRLADGHRWFDLHAPLQPTWNKLIHLHLVATGLDVPTSMDRCQR